MDKKTKVIFLCTGNSARSQMAEAFLRAYAGDEFEVYSAGFEPRPIHSLTRKVMAEIGFDLGGHEAKPLKKFLGHVHFGIIITVCRNAEKLCPTLPGVSTRLFWDLEDPAAFEGSSEEKLEKFREIRDQVDSKVRSFLESRNIPVND